jgi:hypothetical protein
MVDKNISKSFSPGITTVVIPATDKVNGKNDKIKELIQNCIFYLEGITKCRYYPVPTIILNEIPPEDMEQYDDRTRHNDEERKLELNHLGVYFHRNSLPSDEFTKKLKDAKYPDSFINTLFSGGCVAIAYDRCVTYAERESKKRNLKNDNKDELLWDIFNAVLIHEHAHAITVEGIDSNWCQLQYPLNKFYKSYSNKIVCESIAEWACINYYSEENLEEDNPIIHNLLIEHARNNNLSLFRWPYGGAIYLDETFKNDQDIFGKVFDSYRKVGGEAVPLFLSNANELVIKLFCAYKHGNNFDDFSAQISSDKNVLFEAIKFIEDDCFLKKIIDKATYLDGQDANGNTVLMICSSIGNLTCVQSLVRKAAVVNNANKDGNTALILASMNGHQKVVLILLLSGADLNLKNNNNKTAVDVAANEEIRNLISNWNKEEEI